MIHLPCQKNAEDVFIEVEHSQICKYGERSAGDVFTSEKNQNDGRIILTLSDGLGSGVKANVLASLTATMATKCIAANIPAKHVTETIMNMLPVDSVRGISYATFTTVDIEVDGTVHIIEYDNPPYFLVRQNECIELQKEKTEFTRKNKKTAPKVKLSLCYSTYKAKVGDRLIFFSDGVTQSGIGYGNLTQGWELKNISQYILKLIQSKHDISARELSQAIVKKACTNDLSLPKDDISCGVVYFRKPRYLLVISGPPQDKRNDKAIASIFTQFEGKKVIAGGTTSNIIARMLDKKIQACYNVSSSSEVPPYSKMEGADLVCEGIITLDSVCHILENASEKDTHTSEDAATILARLLVNSDRIYFVVGTTINVSNKANEYEEQEIRHTIIKKISYLLKNIYLKDTYIHYI